jgi:hypothetical protein
MSHLISHVYEEKTVQFRPVSAVFIFIGSYFPLAIILAVQDIPVSWWNRSFCSYELFVQSSCFYQPFDHPKMVSLFLLLSLLSIALSHLVFKKISYPFAVDVLTTKPIPNEIINYVFPYVVSFMGISFSEPQKLLGFSVFLIWMFAITYKSGQIMMNPLLLMFGWNLHEVKAKINGTEKDIRVLNKGVLAQGPKQAQKIQEFFVFQD